MFARKCIVGSKQKGTASRFQDLCLAFKVDLLKVGRHGILDSRRNYGPRDGVASGGEFIVGQRRNRRHGNWSPMVTLPTITASKPEARLKEAIPFPADTSRSAVRAQRDGSSSSQVPIIGRLSLRQIAIAALIEERVEAS
jgi:hypothetical protein